MSDSPDVVGTEAGERLAKLFDIPVDDIDLDVSYARTGNVDEASMTIRLRRPRHIYPRDI